MSSAVYRPPLANLGRRLQRLTPRRSNPRLNLCTVASPASTRPLPVRSGGRGPVVVPPPSPSAFSRFGTGYSGGSNADPSGGGPLRSSLPLPPVRCRCVRADRVGASPALSALGRFGTGYSGTLKSLTKNNTLGVKPRRSKNSAIRSASAPVSWTDTCTATNARCPGVLPGARCNCRHSAEARAQQEREQLLLEFIYYASLILQ
jgi:hypothetical protein